MWQHCSFQLIKNLSFVWLLICANFINFYLVYCLKLNSFLLHKRKKESQEICDANPRAASPKVILSWQLRWAVTVRNKLVFVFLIFLLFRGVNWSELGKIHIHIESGAFEWVQGLIKLFVVSQIATPVDDVISIFVCLCNSLAFTWLLA